jgi:hypothetical protein
MRQIHREGQFSISIPDVCSCPDRIELRVVPEVEELKAKFQASALPNRKGGAVNVLHFAMLEG